VAAEPWGLALAPDDTKLVVSSAWGSALTILDASTMAVQRVVPLPRDPRDVIVDDDGVAFVSHLVGAKLSVVDLARDDQPATVDLAVRKSTPIAQLEDRMALRTGVQEYALTRVTLPGRAGIAGPQRILVPMVSVDPGEEARRSSVYYGPPFDGVGKETPIVSVVDPASRQPLSRYLLGTSETQLRRECLLPRAAAVRAKTASLLVACFGLDALLELDALAVDPFRAERRRFALPPGPTGVAVDEVSGRAVVFSQMGAKVSVLRLDEEGEPRPTAIAVDYHPDRALADAARGRLLFYRTDDKRISGDGVACSSCHIDGREDGLTWTTPMGPRQTPMLAGRLADTGPFGWEGDRPTVADYIDNTITRLGGTGLGPADTEELVKFLLVAKPPPGRVAPPQADADLARRGRDLFESAEQSCSGCHAGEMSTDASKHDLTASGLSGIRPFDTPSLRFLRGTAPYFHDGRYETLEALLSDPLSHMGRSSTLPAADKAALAAYLRTL
jgi:mono/diheme cytochrome c family protein